MGNFEDVRVVCQAEVVVNRPHDVFFAFELHVAVGVGRQDRTGVFVVAHHAHLAEVSAVGVTFGEKVGMSLRLGGAFLFCLVIK
jgi:hypothetical protein